MGLIARYRQLSMDEQRLFFRAFVIIVTIRISLRLLPFRVTRNGMERLRRPAGPWRDLDRRRIHQVAWAVQAASRRLPGSTCLAQGMAAQVLLGRLGQRSELRLGVTRKPDGRLEAHAWVESNGSIVLGDAIEGFHRYTPFEKQLS